MSKATPEVKAEVRRLREEQTKLRNLTDGFPSEIEKILYQEAWRVMGISIKEAPIEHGLLRASARVDLPVRDGNVLSVKLSYNTDYAKWVHEKTDEFGQPVNYKAPGTHSQFLMNPLIENIDEMEERIHKRIDKWVKQSVS